MIIRSIAIIIVCSLLTPVALSKDDFDANSFVNSIQKATQRKDVTSVMSYMDKNIEISKEYDSKFKSFNYASYEAYLSKAFPLISAHP